METRTDRHFATLALSAIADADDAMRAAKERLTEAVQEARTLGISWEAIGAELGVTRQAAYDRFGRS